MDYMITTCQKGEAALMSPKITYPDGGCYFYLISSTGHAYLEIYVTDEPANPTSKRFRQFKAANSRASG